MVRLAYRDESVVVQGTEEALHQDSTNAELLHPLEVFIKHSFAGIVIQLRHGAIRKAEISIKEAISRILANVRKEVKYDWFLSESYQEFIGGLEITIARTGVDPAELQ
jgi:hypothetical protein